jgi:hypothetical protein
MPVMIGLWVTLAVMEAREGNFHGLRLNCCFVLQEAGGGALEERSLTARKTVSQQVQQVSKCFYFLL